MGTKRERNIQLAHAVLDWNRAHLRHDALLTETQVRQCFGEDFIVEPNGRHYRADVANYLEFLNGMRATMAGIEYRVIHTVADDDGVVLDMAVQIAHTDGRREDFIAMLLMHFDAKDKVSLWKETYLSRA